MKKQILLLINLGLSMALFGMDREGTYWQDYMQSIRTVSDEQEASNQETVSLLLAFQKQNFTFVENDSIDFVDYKNNEKKYNYSVKKAHELLKEAHNQIMQCTSAWVPLSNVDEETNEYLMEFDNFMKNGDLVKSNDEFSKAKKMIADAKKAKIKEKQFEELVKLENEVNDTITMYQQYQTAKKLKTLNDAISAANDELKKNRQDYKQAFMTKDPEKVKAALKIPIHLAQLK